MVLLFLIGFTLPGVTTCGDVVFYYDARSLGLAGNTTILENNLNPASICLADRLYIYAGGVLFEGREKRGLRVYDSYGNNIGISTIAVNQTSKFDLAPLGVVVPVKLLRFRLNHYELYDFDYYFHKNYRDDFYQIVKIVDDSYRGGLKSISPGIGLNYKFLNIGLEYDFVYGRVERELRTYYPHTGVDSIRTLKRNFSGTSFKCGVILKPLSHFRLAYFFENSFELFDESDTLIYPTGHNFGFFYQPPHRVPTRFLAEMNYKLWDRAIFFYKFAVEHTLLINYAIRYGFCLFPDYNQPAVWSTNLTLGLGGNFKNYCFDFGFALGKRDYTNTDFGGLGIEGKQIFDEVHNHFLLSFGFRL
ncbi:MAG: hypothetical protein N3A65_05815 [candidate division WOR-3 bacterium]|nr:hypothetical protein [candidate division WOR-3 bacterium]